MKLYVGNLSFEAAESELHDLFGQYGKVTEVAMMMDRMTGRSRGFAFVTMDNAAEAKAAMTAVDGHEVGGRKLTVNEARPREERGSGGGGGGGGGYSQNRSFSRR